MYLDRLKREGKKRPRKKEKEDATPRKKEKDNKIYVYEKIEKERILRRRKADRKREMGQFVSDTRSRYDRSTVLFSLRRSSEIT